MIRTIQAKIEEIKTPAEEAERRMKICVQCPEYKALLKICGACGCYLPAKTQLKGATCPKNKW